MHGFSAYVAEHCREEGKRMYGYNKYLFCKYTPVRSFLYLMLISGTIFASSTLKAGIPAEVATYTLQREKTAEFVSSALQAEKLPEVEILEQSGVYQIKVVAVIDAPASSVRHVLTDYVHIYRLNPSIIESEVLKRHDDGSVSVRTKVVGCAAWFCEELDRVERVHLLPSGDLYAEIIPELSEFKSGQTLWRIKAVGEHCEVTYFSDMEPDVFIPPLVGKFLIKKSIREEMQISFANLEKISNIMAEREWQENYQPVHAEFASYDQSESYDPCIDRADNSFDAAY